MSKEKQIKELIDRMGEWDGDRIHDVAAYFFHQWLESQSPDTIELIHSGRKEYWEFV
jgi:hypothetical protein